MIQQPFVTPPIAGDGMDQYLIADGSFRLSFLHGTELVNRMRANHQLNPAGTIVLGQAYMLALLASGTLKNEEKIGLTVECTGEIEGISVEADALGQVRGFLKQPEIQLSSIDIPRKLFGSGSIIFLRYARDLKHPSRGHVELREGTLAENVAWYYADSEQTATLLDVDIHFDDTQNVAGAAAIIVQALPGGDPNELDTIKARLADVRPLGRHFAAGETAANIVHNSLSEWKPKLIATKSAEFFCGCSKERFSRFLAALPEEEKRDILDTGPIPLHTTCHNCNSTYTFSREELDELFLT